MSIFLDFDGTITVEDTIGELANFALSVHRERAANNSTSASASTTTTTTATADSVSSSSSLSDAWAAVVRAYADDHRAGSAAHHTPAAARRTVSQEVEFLRALKGVEERSLARVRRCGLFRDIDGAGDGVGNGGSSRGALLRDAGAARVRDGTVRLRPGYRDFVARRAAEGWKVRVVSVNWSGAFIRGCCSGEREGTGTGTGVGEVEVEVIANEVRDEDGAVVGPEILRGRPRHPRSRRRGESGVEEDAGVDDEGEGEGEGEGEEVSPPPLTNSQDKLDAMRAVLGAEGSLGDNKPSVYVGDSTTDLECLLAADRGIVMADKPDSTLLETLRRIGKEVPHVREHNSSSSNIMWASNFEEINEHVTFDINAR
ncbi:hypothetical protein SLS62_003918 [Diatrype stigma]|uniref:Uncharacterized protein n=1 Tax=Diatrype stigma TaxID=117547 RepID=A0AAN9UVQ6_9PEZI